ncbi:MAG: hypothetical protein HY611_01990 [Elusimicrobia bacterium]|nr:hypothetical protein [Elusimicrobiota bacterium]
MKGRPEFLPAAIAALLISFGTAERLSWLAQGAAAPPDGALRVVERQQAAEAARPPAKTYQRIRRISDKYDLEFGFRNFNGDPLSVWFTLDSKSVELSSAEFGYTEEGLKSLKEWRRQAEAAANAAEAEEVKSQYHARLRSYLASRGFRLLSGNQAAADIPKLARGNSKALRPAALQFSQLTELKNYDSEATIGAALSMVQTALKYRIPPSQIGGRHTGGVYPPLEALVLGSGDCDSKTALLASILLNWSNIRLIGLGVPGHYLMAVQRVPYHGDFYVEYEGNPYVLMEPAGPGWIAPGRVGEETQALLRSSAGLQIEPI